VEILRSLILGLVQGLTEFLPVSSSAHLEVIPALMKWPYWGKVYDVALHMGTFLGILAYYRKEVIELLVDFFNSFKDMKKIPLKFKLRLPWLILVSAFPAMFFALLLKDHIEEFFNPEKFPVAILITAITLIVFGLILGYAERKGSKDRDISSLTFAQALLIGLAQALALIPGVSRSGITMTAGLFVGLHKDSTANYSFLVSVPIMAAAALYQGYKCMSDPAVLAMWPVFLAGIVSSAVSGFLVIRFLLNYLKKGSFKVFVIYRVALGLALIAAYFFMFAR